MLKLFEPYMSWRATWNAVRVLRSGQLAEGPRVKEFERALARTLDVQPMHVVTVNSGTSALELAFELAGVGPGDEVIVPVLTCVATVLPAVRRGAKVVFADVNRNLTIDTEDVERKVTKKTKAIVFVYFGGCGIGIEACRSIARNHRIRLIEDAAQAMGHSMVGSGDLTALSFQATKSLTTVDGGALIVRSQADATRARLLRWFGMDRESPRGTTDAVKDFGYKYHMNDLTAAIGIGNLRSFPEQLSGRTRVAEQYYRNGVRGSIWFAHTFVHDRDLVIKELRASGFESGLYHYRLDGYDIFGGRQHLPVMDEIESQYLLLPVHPRMSNRQVGKVCSIVNAHSVE